MKYTASSQISWLIFFLLRPKPLFLLPTIVSQTFLNKDTFFYSHNPFISFIFNLIGYWFIFSYLFLSNNLQFLFLQLWFKIPSEYLPYISILLIEPSLNLSFYSSILYPNVYLGIQSISFRLLFLLILCQHLCFLIFRNAITKKLCVDLDLLLFNGDFSILSIVDSLYFNSLINYTFKNMW